MKYLISLSLLVWSALLAAEEIPYKVHQKKFPLGTDYNKILPMKVGEWYRYAFHDFVPGQEQGHVYYKKGESQIYVEFGKALDQEDMKTVWSKLYTGATDGRESQIKQKNTTSTSTKYVLMLSKSNFFYAWTRNLFYFSIRTRHKADADDFMKSFPW